MEVLLLSTVLVAAPADAVDAQVPWGGSGFGAALEGLCNLCLEIKTTNAPNGKISSLIACASPHPLVISYRISKVASN